ncbi:MAG TPA: hypothetical protein VGF76_20665, partial [Polyangiaceae bacterium]
MKAYAASHAGVARRLNPLKVSVPHTLPSRQSSKLAWFYSLACVSALFAVAGCGVGNDQSDSEGGAGSASMNNTAGAASTTAGASGHGSTSGGAPSTGGGNAGAPATGKGGAGSAGGTVGTAGGAVGGGAGGVLSNEPNP